MSKVVKAPRREGVQGMIDHHIDSLIDDLQRLREGGGYASDEDLWNIVKIYGLNDIFKEVKSMLLAGYESDAISGLDTMKELIQARQ